MGWIKCNHCGDEYQDFDVAHVCSRGVYAPKIFSGLPKRKVERLENGGFVAIEMSDIRKGDIFRLDGERLYSANSDSQFYNGTWGCFASGYVRFEE